MQLDANTIEELNYFHQINSLVPIHYIVDWLFTGSTINFQSKQRLKTAW